MQFQQEIPVLSIYVSDEGYKSMLGQFLLKTVGKQLTRYLLKKVNDKVWHDGLPQDFQKTGQLKIEISPLFQIMESMLL